VPPLTWLAQRTSASVRPEPTRIGPFPAIQIREVLRRRWGRNIILGESILRVAFLPGGQRIRVQYTPMSDLTIADLKLLDAVCDAVRVDDPALRVTPQAAMEQVGCQIPLPAGSQVSLSQLADVPGLFVSGLEDGLPAWSLGVFRTWLAGNRTPRDLLVDLAATFWRLDAESVRTDESTRTDGARLASVRHPDPSRNRLPLFAAWIVARSPAEAVLLFVCADERYVSGAHAAGQRIAEQLAIQPISGLASLSSAEEAGLKLATLLAQRGALPWWGRDPVRLVYRETFAPDHAAVEIERVAHRRDPKLGYEGSLTRRTSGRNWEERTEWWIDAQALGYRQESVTFVGDGVPLEVSERRLASTNVVHRTIKFADQDPRSTPFQIGPAFVCPPIESIAEAWVARQTEGAWLIEASTRQGRGAHHRLLRPLPPEADRLPRVLLLDDYWPLGTIVAFDEDGEVRYQLDAATRYERVR